MAVTCCSLQRMKSILNSSPVLLLIHLILLTRISWSPMECAFSSVIFPSETSSTNGAKKYSVRDPVLPRGRNFWELISSSSDTIPVRNRSISDNFLPGQTSVETRLQKLEHHFITLKVYDEDCRQRLLCNLAENPAKYAPLSNALLEETRYAGDEKTLATALLASNHGARLLTYIEAAEKGFKKSGCDIWTYRCPQTAMSMFDYKALLIWREVSKWLTVNFVAKRS